MNLLKRHRELTNWRVKSLRSDKSAYKYRRPQDIPDVNMPIAPTTGGMVIFYEGTDDHINKSLLFLIMKSLSWEWDDRQYIFQMGCNMARLTEILCIGSSTFDRAVRYEGESIRQYWLRSDDDLRAHLRSVNCPINSAICFPSDEAVEDAMNDLIESVVGASVKDVLALTSMHMVPFFQLVSESRLENFYKKKTLNAHLKLHGSNEGSILVDKIVQWNARTMSIIYHQFKPRAYVRSCALRVLKDYVDNRAGGGYSQAFEVPLMYIRNSEFVGVHLVLSTFASIPKQVFLAPGMFLARSEVDTITNFIRGFPESDVPYLKILYKEHIFEPIRRNKIANAVDCAVAYIELTSDQHIQNHKSPEYDRTKAMMGRILRGLSAPGTGVSLEVLRRMGITQDVAARIANIGDGSAGGAMIARATEPAMATTRAVKSKSGKTKRASITSGSSAKRAKTASTPTDKQSPPSTAIRSPQDDTQVQAPDQRRSPWNYLSFGQRLLERKRFFAQSLKQIPFAQSLQQLPEAKKYPFAQSLQQIPKVKKYPFAQSLKQIPEAKKYPSAQSLKQIPEAKKEKFGFLK